MSNYCEQHFSPLWFPFNFPFEFLALSILKCANLFPLFIISRSNCGNRILIGTEGLWDFFLNLSLFLNNSKENILYSFVWRDIVLVRHGTINHTWTMWLFPLSKMPDLSFSSKHLIKLRNFEQADKLHFQ